MSRVISDKNAIRFYAYVWIAGYLVTYFFLKNYLPDEYFRDSVVIQKLALSDDVYQWGGAYSVAALVAHILPEAALNGLVAVLGCCTIWVIINSLKTLRGMALIVPVLIPCVILNLMMFGKESFVIPMTFLILWLTGRSRSTLHAIIAICFVYFIYGMFFRDYYLIILAVFIGCIILRNVSAPFRLLIVLISVLALFILPSKLFMDMQGDRDRINYLANLVYPIVHTAILNPLPPNSAYHFIVNYFYVVWRLSLPFTLHTSSSEVVLFINVLIYGRLIYVGLKNRQMGPISCLPLLFIAHILVLIIFEPDAGSYLRHASSVFIYLLPALRLVEDAAYAREQKKPDNLNAIHQEGAA